MELYNLPCNVISANAFCLELFLCSRCLSVCLSCFVQKENLNLKRSSKRTSSSACVAVGILPLAWFAFSDHHRLPSTSVPLHAGWFHGSDIIRAPTAAP